MQRRCRAAPLPIPAALGPRRATGRGGSAPRPELRPRLAHSRPGAAPIPRLASRPVPPRSAAGGERSAGCGGRRAGQRGEVFRALRSQLRLYPAEQSRRRAPPPHLALPTGPPRDAYAPKPPPSRKEKGFPARRAAHRGTGGDRCPPSPS